MTSTEIKTIELIVNSEQAKKRLDELNQRLATMKQKREEALDKGDSKGLQIYTREIQKIEREIRNTESRAKTLGTALSNLDKATPNELKRTLRELQKELSSGKVARGSKEWDTLTKSIRETKTALAQVNDEMKAVKNVGFMDRVAEWNSKWMGLMLNLQAGLQIITGLRQGMQSLVAEFAEIEEQLANTRKYTGMSVDEVEQLNLAFRNMDTRTSREKLNELAQEAGRLGKNTLEDVQGYVEAADILNVALVDLGNGATQTIAKLTNIFGVEELLGTKEAMLSVGSTVNVLSQNCTASKPYLVEFAQRMAGVGAQAGMTIPEILAFGAALDANGQKVEMSASAIGKLTMNLFQKPAEIARQVGLNVEQFTETLKRSTNEGLLMFLERINQLGDKDGLAALAPMFKDLGMDGVRMSQVLATLAKHLDMVRWEQEEANKAFNQATSATKEYEIFNNTVQAGLEKARKGVREMRIELGEKLQPVAAHFLNFTTAFLRVLSATITFIGKHKAAILTLTAAIVAYTIAVNASTIATKAKAAAMVLVNGVTKAYTATVKALHAAHLLLQLGMAKLQGNWARQSALMLDVKNVGAALKTGWGALIAVGVLLVGTLWTQIKRYGELRREKESARRAQEDYRHAVSATIEVSQKAQGVYLTEKKRIDQLRKTIQDNTKSVKERQNAINALQRIVPGYLASLNKEGKLIERNTGAINNYLVALKKKAVAEALYEKLRESISKEADAEMAAQSWERGIKFRLGQIEIVKKQNQQRSDYTDEVTGGWTAGFQETAVARAGTGAINNGEMERQQSILKYDQERLAFWRQRQSDEQAYQNALWDYAKQKGATKELEALVAAGGNSVLAPDPGFGDTTPEYTGDGNTGKGGKTGKTGKDGKSTPADPHKEEREKIEREALAARIFAEMQYRAGIIEHREFEEQVLIIEAEMLQKQQALYEEGSEEWNKLQQKRWANERAQIKQYDDWSLEDIARQEQEEIRATQEKYLAGQLSEEQYQQALSDIKLKYLKKRKDFTEQVQSEYAPKYAQQYEEEEYKQRLERQKKFLQQAQKMQEEYFKKSLDEQEQEEIALLQELIQAGVIAKEKEEVYKAEITKKYAKLRKEQADKETEEEKKRKKEEDEKKGKLEDPLSNGNNTGMDEWSQSFITIMENLNSLQQKLKDGEASWQDYAAVATASLGMISAIASSFSNLYQAEQRAEEQAVERKYDKEIEKAGKNSKKKKKLEEQKEKELAALKNKYNDKAMAMELAQAVASTAMAAINAYASAAAIPNIGWIMAPIAAGLALAAGAVQIATIKKQHAAEESSGYYSGGFTKGRNYRREAGVVHEGEFVANHEAVNNPQLLPVLRLIDHAQRTNTVARLTAEDVSRTLPGSATAVRYGSMPTVNATEKVAQIITDPAYPRQSAPPTQISSPDILENTEMLRLLKERLEQPIETYVTIDGPNGIDRQYTKYKKMMNRK